MPHIDARSLDGWARATWDAIRPFSTGRTYVNRRYDPDALFRVNENVAPSGATHPGRG